MTFAGWLEIALTLALVALAARPLGGYMVDVFENRPTFLTPALRPLERGLYRTAGVDPNEEQEWLAYAASMLIFTGACFLALYAILRLQNFLPLNPQGFDAVPPASLSTLRSASSPTPTGRLMEEKRPWVTLRRWSGLPLRTCSTPRWRSPSRSR